MKSNIAHWYSDAAARLWTKYATTWSFVVFISTPGAQASDWAMLHKTDPMTDEKITATYESHTEGTSIRTAIVRCQGNNLQVRFDFGEVMSGLERVPVRYRFDKNPTVERNAEERWGMTTSLTGVMPKDDAELIEFAHQMMAASSLVFEVDGDEIYRATFDLSGAAAMIVQVLNNCGP